MSHSKFVSARRPNSFRCGSQLTLAILRSPAGRVGAAAARAGPLSAAGRHHVLQPRRADAIAPADDVRTATARRHTDRAAARVRTLARPRGRGRLRPARLRSVLLAGYFLLNICGFFGFLQTR
jgi:hypothetical protein